MLHIRALSKQYLTPEGPLTVIHDLDLDLTAGSSLALMGESGSGKSTLLHLIAGLDQADGGSIQLAGDRLPAAPEAARAVWRRDRLGLVFQQFNLIPALDVAANLDFQARLNGRHDPQWSARLVDRLGLGSLLRRYPEQLSGGQQQRVAIGRALASRPPLILADEPTGSLDQQNADEVMGLLLELVTDSGSSLLMVTHSQRQAARLDACRQLVRGQLL